MNISTTTLTPSAPSQESPPRFSSRFWRQFRLNRKAVWAVYVVAVLFGVAVFADFLASEKPLICSYNKEWSLPVLRSYGVAIGICSWSPALQNADWQKLNYDFAIFAPIPYGSKLIAPNDRMLSPLGRQNAGWRRRHWFGTDDLGRDVLAVMIHGTRLAYAIGIFAMSIAAFIGVLLGSVAGYWHDDKLRLPRGTVFLLPIWLFLALFYGFYMRAFVLSDAFCSSLAAFAVSGVVSLLILVGILVIGLGLTNFIVPKIKIPFLGQSVAVPLDLIINRGIEIVVSIPTLFLILAVLAVAKPSVFNVMLILGLTGWTGIARFVRAELLRIRNLAYIESARSMGYSSLRILRVHALPNALTPVFISIAFGVAGAIVAESFLSFLGIGVPPEVVTWGKLLALARETPQAWWLAVFPGTAIFVTVTMFNLIGEGLTDALNPQLDR